MYLNVFIYLLIFWKCNTVASVSDGTISEDQIRSQKYSVNLQTLYAKAKKNKNKNNCSEKALS